MDDTLFQSIYNKDNLYSAWLRVKEKNTTGGIDNKTVRDYDANVGKYLDILTSQLQTGTYRQLPYREVFIPKKENEKRRLGLLTVNDKIVQTAVANAITPIVESISKNVSYAYRAKKGAIKAIHRLQHLINNQKFVWLASCDIDNYFDTIPHAALFSRLSEFLKSPGTLELIKMFVTMGRVNKNYQWKDNCQGIPQGGVVSPLLANLYLTSLDNTMIDKGYGFVRYSDDFILLGHTYAEAKNALDEATKLIKNQLQLALNEEGKVVAVNEGFEFLGIYFRNGSLLDLSEKKFNRLVEKMQEAARAETGINFSRLRETMQGIENFYGRLITQEKLELLDDELLKILKLKSDIMNLSYKGKESAIKLFPNLPLLAKSHVLNKTSYIQEFFFGAQAVKDSRESKRKSIYSREAVISRKHEYQKLESSAFDIVVTQPGLFLGKKNKTVVIKNHEKLIKEVPIINLKNITILSDGICLSSNLIKCCSEHGVSVDFLGHDGFPYAMIMTPAFFTAEIGRAQLEAYSNGKAFLLIRQFVYGKIHNQNNLIKYFGKYYLTRNEDFKNNYSSFIQSMKHYMDETGKIRDDHIDTFRQKMFALEGQAAACYWDMVGTLIKPKVPFYGRKNQGATDLFNSLLNYGYGILYARVSEALIRARLNPCLSYLHKPVGKRPSLVYDFIEEFRNRR